MSYKNVQYTEIVVFGCEVPTAESWNLYKQRNINHSMNITFEYIITDEVASS